MDPGFTLVEMMVVVVIISAMAVLAVPTIGKRLRGRWTEQANIEFLMLYRNARMHTASRGSAVLFRYDSAPKNGSPMVQVLEAVHGGTDTDWPMPVSSCSQANWGAGRQIAVSQDNHYLSQVVEAHGPAPSTAKLDRFDVCFSPLGQSYFRSSQDGQFAALTGVLTLRVFGNAGGQTPVGLVRRAVLLPNGTSRLAVAQ